MSVPERSRLLGLCVLAAAISLARFPRPAVARKQPATKPRSKADEAASTAELLRKVRQAMKEAAALTRGGEYAKALPKSEAVLGGLRQLYGNRDHPNVAASLYNVAGCLDMLSRPAEALPKYEAALAMYRRIHKGRDHLDVASCLSATARCLRSLGRPAEALPRFKAAVAMHLKLPNGKDDVSLARDVKDTANCLEALQQWADALPFRRASLAMCQRLHRNRDHPAVVAGLNNLAVCLRHLGRSAEALVKYEAALAMCRRLHGERDHPAVLACLDNVGACLDALGRWEEALPKHKAALAMRQRTHKDRDHPDLAGSLNKVAVCLQRLGRSKEALPKYEAALAMSRRFHGGRDHPDVAAYLSNLASCLESLGRSMEAVSKCAAALAMCRRLYKNDHPDVARGLNNLAAYLDSLGRSAEALPNYETALAMYQRIYKGRDHPHVAANLNNMALCLQDLGRSGQALPQCEAALAMAWRLHKRRDHPDVATYLHNLAMCLQDLGRPAEALPLHEAAVAMNRRLRKGRDHPHVARNLRGLAFGLRNLGRPAEALLKAQAALAMYQRIHKGRDHPHVAAGLNNVAGYLDSVGRSAEALLKAQAALAMHQRIHGGRDHPHVAASLNNVGFYLQSLARPEDALAKYQAAEAMYERLHSPETFKCASNLGRLYLEDLARPGEAAQAFEKAVVGMEAARVRLGGSDVDRAGYFAHLRRWGAFEGMIRAQLRLRRADKALEYAERGRALGLRDVLERGKRLHGGDLLGTIEAAARQRGDDALLREVAETRRTEREAFGRVATLSAQVNLMRSRTDLTAAQRRESIRRLSAQLGKALEAHLAARRLAFNLAGTHAVHDIKPLAAGQIQALLSGKQRLLVYTISDKDAVLLLVPPAGGKIRGLSLKWPNGRPVDEATLRKAVAGYVSGMIAEGKLARGVRRKPARKHSPAEHASLGYRLFRALIPPVLWEELTSAEQIYVVPDGVLHRLPFETLIVEEAKGTTPSAGKRRYWIDAGPPLIYAPSATVLVNRKTARDQQIRRLARGGLHKRQAVLLGDPVFGRTTAPQTPVPKQGAVARDPKAASAADPLRTAHADRSGYLSRYGPLTPLPGTRREVRRIYRALVGREYRRDVPNKRVAVLLGADATRTRLFQAASGCRYLHLATHGLVDTSRRAIYSSLALTQPKVATRQDFGFLTLLDLFDHWWGRLGATELVVLSACDTQRGRIEAGEGVYGMPWGFMYAGSPAVIASLWQVSDESTAEMMGTLYEAISRQPAPQQGPSKLRAFVAVRKALRKKYPQPYFWAPFIYIGDPR